MLTAARQTDLILSYNNQLSSRFHSNSMGLQVLICLLLILILVVEIIKIVKKTYQWQTEYEINLDQKYAEESSVLQETSAAPIDDQNQDILKAQKKIPEGQAADKPPAQRRKKPGIHIPSIVLVQDIIKRNMPQLAILAINLVMLSSYEFTTISAYIVIVLIIISEILGLKEPEHMNLKFALDIITKLLLIGWYINVFAVGKPGPF